MLPLFFRLGIALALVPAITAYPTFEHEQDISDPFSEPLDDGPSLYRAWRESREPQAAAWTLQEEQVTVQMGMKRRVEAFANWLNPWGEGQITVFDIAPGNLTMPHRPAAFPAHLPLGAGFPLTGILEMITDFPSAPGLPNATTDIYGCTPVTPIVQHASPRNAARIALVVRGHCSFSHKVRAAQARGANAVLVADDTASDEETEEQGRTRFGLLTMYSPDDTNDIHVPSSFISRASFLVIRDLMNSGHSALNVLIEPDDGYDWPLSDLLIFVMLLPSVITLFTILLNKYRAHRQRQRDRAPREAVLSLPEAIWIPEQWEKEEDSPAPSTRVREYPEPTETNPLAQAQATTSTVPDFSPEEPTSGEHVDPSAPPPQDTSPPKPKPKRRKYYSKDECSICLGSFERGDVIRILPCGHLFHKTEVDDWLVKWKKVCPVCRMDITAAPTADTLALPAETATTPLVAPDQLDTNSTNADEAPVLRSYWLRMRSLLARRERPEGEADEEVPLLR
ncbi:hypothetical protein NliqN6_0090 [Naganishia liquefaciens]|uniref:RING-type E3 ubiquitin transferase n=1 Tax=Naganishia liquefaciens TaxID=104408 RepID=A0A8H3TMW2_9TREE|nr:hypothetical protein NliqN6_0090 [Naganishia liquefaciens]